VEAGTDDEETENRVHEIMKNNGQNIGSNCIAGCELWGAKWKIKVIFWSRNLSDGTYHVKTKGRTNKLINDLSVWSTFSQTTQSWGKTWTCFYSLKYSHLALKETDFFADTLILIRSNFVSLFLYEHCEKLWSVAL
jgi:hypothetical protein